MLPARREPAQYLPDQRAPARGGLVHHQTARRGDRHQHRPPVRPRPVPPDQPPAHQPVAHPARRRRRHVQRRRQVHHPLRSAGRQHHQRPVLRDRDFLRRGAQRPRCDRDQRPARRQHRVHRRRIRRMLPCHFRDPQSCASVNICIVQRLYVTAYCPVGTARIPRLPGVARIRSSRMTQHARAGPGHRAFRRTNARTTVVREKNSRTAASSTPSSLERRQGPRRAAWCPASGRRPAGSRRPPRRWSRLVHRKNARVHRLLYEPAGHRPATSTTSRRPARAGRGPPRHARRAMLLTPIVV